MFFQLFLKCVVVVVVCFISGIWCAMKRAKSISRCRSSWAVSWSDPSSLDSYPIVTEGSRSGSFRSGPKSRSVSQSPSLPTTGPSSPSGSSSVSSNRYDIVNGVCEGGGGRLDPPDIIFISDQENETYKRQLCSPEINLFFLKKWSFDAMPLPLNESPGSIND